MRTQPEGPGSSPEELGFRCAGTGELLWELDHGGVLQEQQCLEAVWSRAGLGAGHVGNA